MRIFPWWATIISCLVLVSRPVSASVKPDRLFASGAVLQQGMDVPVWGTANEGEKVSVKFQGQVVSTVAKNGRWLVKLKPLNPGGPFTMTINGDDTVEIPDLLVGEVWLCGGQSNMQFGLKGATDGEKHRAAANDSLIRLFTVPRVGPTQPKRETDNHWWHCDSNTVAYFSAVGYFFARDLRQDLKVPVGLISANVGGSMIERWMPWEAFESTPALQKYIATRKRPAPDQMTNGTPSTLYLSMIEPLQPYAIRGVIWYQGESNTDAPHYRMLFPALIKGWRDAWQQGEFPFLFVQIAPGCSPFIREAQLSTWKSTTNTAMTVITDCTIPDLHPPWKEPIGQRLALAARALAYGEKIEYSGPIYDSMKINGDHIMIKFQHVGGGLVAKGGQLRGFTIAGADGKFVKGTARIDGATVVVSNPDVPHPQSVRFGWNTLNEVELYNQEGLPASMFRTDEMGQ